MKGENRDGHEYISQAVRNGCVAVMVSCGGEWMRQIEEADASVIEVADTVEALGMLAKHYLESLHLKKVAVTGSVGKTTVRDMIYYVLSEKYRCGCNIKKL